MKNLREDIRAAFLGATGGLFSFSVILLIARVDEYYAYLSCVNADPYPYCAHVDRLEWIPFCFWHLVLSITASLMVHRYLPALRNTPFMLWQTVGITTGLGWLLSFCIVVVLRCLMDGETDFIAHALTSAPYAALAKYVAVGLACNVLFGSAMMTASRNEVSTEAR